MLSQTQTRKYTHAYVTLYAAFCMRIRCRCLLLFILSRSLFISLSFLLIHYFFYCFKNKFRQEVQLPLLPPPFAVERATDCRHLMHLLHGCKAFLFISPPFCDYFPLCVSTPFLLFFSDSSIHSFLSLHNYELMFLLAVAFPLQLRALRRRLTLLTIATLKL